MKKTIIDGVKKIELVEEDNYYMVTFYELMGERYVRLGQPERYSKELAEEEFDF